MLLIFFLSNCSKPKTVLICGDHICVNKAEANQYFEENLTIEVRIIGKKINKNFDLVELNLKQKENGKKKINLQAKDQTSKKIKKLSNDEIQNIKDKIKKNKNKKIVKNKTKKANIINKKEKVNELQVKKKKNKPLKESKTINKDFFNIDVNKKHENVVDVCTILEKCSIEEISKYLLKQGKKKNFPDITVRQ